MAVPKTTTKKAAKKKAPNKIGRPRKYSAAVAATICREIAGGASMRKACEKAKVTPAAAYLWLMQEKAFFDNYAQARSEQADKFADEIVEIADSAEDAQLGRLRVDARKWVASKLKPKKYGDKLDLTQDVTIHEVVIGGDDEGDH